MKKLSVLLIFLLFSCGKDSSVTVEKTGVVKGKVFEIINSEDVLLSGITVSLGTETFITTSTGLYQFNQITAGNKTLTANGDYYSEFSADITVIEGENEYNINLTESRLKAKVYGNISNSLNEPLPGALVRLAGSSTQTDANGYYEFSTVPQGENLVEVELESYLGFEEIKSIVQDDYQYNITLSAKIYNKPSIQAFKNGKREIILTWEGETGTTLTGYNIYQSVNNGDFELLTEAAISKSISTFTKSGLTDGLYSFKITSVNIDAIESQVSFGTIPINVADLVHQIAFTSNHESNNQEIYLIDIDGGAAVRLTDSSPLECSSPSWSPDGTKITFSREGEIFVMENDGSNVTQITFSNGNSKTPSWSPDGTQIAFASVPDTSTVTAIFVMDAVGDNMKQITNLSDECFDPDWSPDGTQFVFTRKVNDSDEIYLIDTDGSNIGLFFQGSTYDLFDPVWSPDGGLIAFIAISLSFNDIGIYTKDLTASFANLISSSTPYEGPPSHPSWSKDGLIIAFARDGELWRINTNQSNLKRLTYLDRLCRDPVWSPVKF